jgi:hypothetical protein
MSLTALADELERSKHSSKYDIMVRTCVGTRRRRIASFARGWSEYQDCRIEIFDERANCMMARTKQPLDFLRRAVSNVHPNHFGRSTEQERQIVEITVFAQSRDPGPPQRKITPPNRRRGEGRHP